MAEKNFMNFEDELMSWDSSFIRVIGIKHGLLNGKSVTEQPENSSFVFVVSKNGRITIDEIQYS